MTLKKIEHRITALEDSLKELAELGSPLDLAVEMPEFPSCHLEIEQSGNPEDNKIFELEDGRTAYMFCVGLTNQTSKSMYIDDVDLLSPWEPGLIEWLPPHTITYKDRKKTKASSYEQYRFPGRNGLELPFEEVINRALTPGARLFTRRPVRGWLLATGGLMPKGLLQGAEINSTLVITTSDHLEHRKEIVLWGERLQNRPTHRNRTSSLFERPAKAEHGTENQHFVAIPEDSVSNDGKKG
jgi:hypothetical protein